MYSAVKLHLSIVAISLTLVISTFGRAVASNPAGAFAVYFVSVGSSDYIQPDKPGEVGFTSVDGANKSARLVGKLLSEGGASKGIVLNSALGHFVGLQDIRAAINAIQTQLKTDRGVPNPFFVFYFAGHGISDGIAWNHFSVPGNFLYTGDVYNLNIEALADETLYADSLADQLDKAKVPYLAILDTCYDGKPAILESPVLSERAMQNIKDTADALKVINQFRQVNPVLFSTEPGTTVETVPDPDDPSSNRVAPLARRIMLVLDKASKDHQTLTLENFLDDLRASDLDQNTKPPVTFAEPATFWRKDLFSFGENASGAAEARLGTASAPEICCNKPVPSATGESMTPDRNMLGSVDLSGPLGEYVTDGEKYHIGNPDTPISMAQYGPGDIDITIGSEENAWEIGLSTPNSERFALRHYSHAVRYSFAEHGQAGLSVSSSGRGCNEVKGDFVVTEVAYDTAGRLVHIAANFRQLCDDVPVALTGSLNLR
jgi:hypothetical protein